MKDKLEAFFEELRAASCAAGNKAPQSGDATAIFSARLPDRIRNRCAHVFDRFPTPDKNGEVWCGDEIWDDFFDDLLDIGSSVSCEDEPMLLVTEALVALKAAATAHGFTSSEWDLTLADWLVRGFLS